MSKKLNLTIGERYAALKLFDAFKGSLTEMAAIIDDVKTLTISADEWEKANRKFLDKSGMEIKEPVNSGDVTSITWTEEASEKSIELDQASIDYIKKSIKEKSEKSEFTFADVAFISLNKKLS